MTKAIKTKEAVPEAAIILMPDSIRDIVLDRLPPNGQAMLISLETQAAKLGATLQRGKQQSDRLKRKIEASPDFVKKREIDARLKAGVKKLEYLNAQIATLNEQALYDVPGDDLFDKGQAIAAGGGR